MLYAKPLNKRLIILLQKKNTLKKTPFSGKSLISTCSIFCGWEGKWGGVGVSALFSLTGNRREWVGGGRLFEAGRLLPFSAFRTGAYSRWALMRNWALIRIKTVLQH